MVSKQRRLPDYLLLITLFAHFPMPNFPNYLSCFQGSLTHGTYRRLLRMAEVVVVAVVVAVAALVVEAVPSHLLRHHPLFITHRVLGPLPKWFRFVRTDGVGQ